MPIAIKMPALSPTMEQGKLAKWLVKVGDKVSSGDIMAEIETDKATMEFEAVDEGTILSIEVAEGAENVPVGTVIAQLSGEDDVTMPATKPAAAPAPVPPAAAPVAAPAAVMAKSAPSGDRIIASPLAKRLAAEKNVDLATVKGTGPNGRIVRADVEGAQPGVAAPSASVAADDGILVSPVARRLAAELNVDLSTLKGTGPSGRIVRVDVENAPRGTANAAVAPATASPTVVAGPAAPAPAATSVSLTTAIPDFGIPFADQKLSGMRKTIARRLTESKQTVPHIYLTVDVRLDALLKLRAELNDALASRGVKLSVNDLLIKALGQSLMQVPACNVAFGGDVMRQYARADISVAVSIPGGLITPIVTDAGGKGVAQISTEMAALAAKAKAGKLQPSEYQGGTASLSNMGMMGIKQFEAVINPPQGMIMAIGAGEKRPWVMPDGSLGVATVMCATGSFDHRAIDGADGAQLMAAFRELVEKPLGLVA